MVSLLILNNVFGFHFDLENDKITIIQYIFYNKFINFLLFYNIFDKFSKLTVLF
jgi:hypothetical protein